MKSITFLMILLCGFLSLNAQENVKEKNLNPDNKKNMVEVIYMHSSHRCELDLDIEEQLKSIIKTYYDDQVQKSKLVLNIYDTDDEKNQKIVDLYEPEAQTLLIIIYDKDGKVTKEDYSDFAFSNISAPDKFIDGFKKILDKALEKI